jgi:hypothetical protein
LTLKFIGKFAYFLVKKEFFSSLLTPHFEVSLLVPGNLPPIPNKNPTNPNKFASANPRNPNVNLIMLGNKPDKKPMSIALPKANNKAHIREMIIFFAIIFVPSTSRTQPRRMCDVNRESGTEAADQRWLQ